MASTFDPPELSAPPIVDSADASVSVNPGVRLDRSASGRLPMVDVVRFICVAWVMWIHIPDSPALAATTTLVRFRLPVFVMLATFFLFVSQQRRPRRTLLQYARERLVNLYVPFLGWAAIFYLLHGCIDRFVLHAGWPAVSRGILFHGQTVHLWFVPFVVALGIMTFPAARWLLGWREGSEGRSDIILAATLLAGLLIAAAAPTLTDAFIDYNDRVHVKDLLYRALTLAPSVPLGAAGYFLFERLRRRDGHVPRSVGVMGLSAFCICLLANFFMRSNPLLESITGFAVVLIAISPMDGGAWPSRAGPDRDSPSRALPGRAWPGRVWPGRAGPWLAACGRYTFGMYLVHMLFVDVLKTFRQSWLGMPPTWWYDVLVFVLCLPLSLLLSVALNRNRYTHWLAPAGVRAVERRREQ